ncbi:MAG: endonuclease/exonuclease/phosphatase family protein [Pirellulales bacterium]
MLVSITGWQVLQKYKGEGFSNLLVLGENKWNGFVGKTPAQPTTDQYVQYDAYGRPIVGAVPPVSQYDATPQPGYATQYGGQQNAYAQPVNYGQTQQYPTSNGYQQPYPNHTTQYGQPTQQYLAPLNQNPLVHTQPYGYAQNPYEHMPQPTTVGYPQPAQPSYGTQVYATPITPAPSYPPSGYADPYAQPHYGQPTQPQPTQPQPYASAQPYGAPLPTQPIGNTQPTSQNAATIRIASFNIQVFGESKLRKPDAMRVLVDLVHRFDVVAIQEVRATSDEILPRFVAELNATGRRYDFVIGPREGRTSSKEQYAYVYDTATIECDRSSVFSAQNPNNLLHRTPLVASFRTRNAPPQQAFTFTCVNIHTDPDEVKTEVPALVEVVRAVREQLPNEDDIFLMGDLNADEAKLGPLLQIPNFTPIVSRTPTNTRGTEQYDNFFYPRDRTPEYTGRWGVVDFAQEYGLTLEQALQVSDHRPIWAEFGVYENQSVGGSHLTSQPAAAGWR